MRFAQCERACSHCPLSGGEVKNGVPPVYELWDKPKDERCLCSACEDWLTCSMCAKTKWFKQFSRTQRQKWGKDPKKGGRKCNCCITKLYGKRRDMGLQKLKVRSLVALMRRYFVKVAVVELVRVLRLRANISMHLESIAGISGISLRLRCWKASCEQAAAAPEASAADAEFKPAGFDEAAAAQRQRKSSQKKEKNRRKAARKKVRGLVEGEEVQLVRSGGECGGIAAMQLNQCCTKYGTCFFEDGPKRVHPSDTPRPYRIWRILPEKLSFVKILGFHARAVGIDIQQLFSEPTKSSPEKARNGANVRDGSNVTPSL